MSLRAPEDQDIIIVGATGDLARRKLLPALWNLHRGALLPVGGRIIGAARGDQTAEQFRASARTAIERFSRTPPDESWEGFARRLDYVSTGADGYATITRSATLPRQLVYLATPPSSFPSIVQALGQSGLVRGARLIIEKPFGRDIASARELERVLHEVFDERQIFRIDHYLGKETVQNVLVFRFGNSMFERVWNRDAIESVQFTVAESIGLEGRGAFYEETGALRDIIQNHVLQVMALLCMEPPSSFAAEAIRDEKAKVLHALRPVEPAEVVRGQYTAGRVGGEDVPGYREEEGVTPHSMTETFAALKMYVDNWRWSGVPFYLRTGKRLPRRATEVLIQFHRAPLLYFPGVGVEHLRSNHLTIEIQPDESIIFAFLAKIPGPEIEVQHVRMQFSYGQAFSTTPEEAYERLIHDAMDGDHTLFVRSDAVELSWRALQPVLDDMPPLSFYPAGSWGPPEANWLLGDDKWHLK